MRLIRMVCPNCNANLQFDLDRKQAFCMYCGARVLIDNENEYTFRHIDEARIREAEYESMIRMRELDIEENKDKSKHIYFIIAYGIALAFVLIGMLVNALDIGRTVGSGYMYMSFGMFIGLGTLVITLPKNE